MDFIQKPFKEDELVMPGRADARPCHGSTSAESPGAPSRDALPRHNSRARRRCARAHRRRPAQQADRRRPRHQHQDGGGAPRQHHGKAERQHRGRPAEDRARRCASEPLGPPARLDRHRRDRPRSCAPAQSIAARAARPRFDRAAGRTSRRSSWSATTPAKPGLRPQQGQGLRRGRRSAHCPGTHPGDARQRPACCARIAAPQRRPDGARHPRCRSPLPGSSSRRRKRDRGDRRAQRSRRRLSRSSAGRLVAGLLPGLRPCTPSGLHAPDRAHGIAVRGSSAVRDRPAATPISAGRWRCCCCTPAATRPSPSAPAATPRTSRCTTRQADVVVAAVEASNATRSPAPMVKAGRGHHRHVGANRDAAGKLCGDVDFAASSRSPALSRGAGRRP